MIVLQVIVFALLLISAALVFWVWADIIRDAIRRRHESHSKD